MRRKDRAVLDQPSQQAILDRCKVLHLGMIDGSRPYVVPLNFGYVWADRLTLYCHSAAQGRKIDVLTARADVCFSMACDCQLIPGPTGCAYSMGYASLLGEGTVRFVTDDAEKRAALDALMRHQTGQQGFAYDDASVAQVAVFAIEVAELSGKRLTPPEQ